MAHSLQLNFRLSCPEDLPLTDLRQVAQERILAASMIAEGRQTHEEISKLLWDAEALLEAASAREAGKKIKLANQRTATLDELLQHTLAIQYAIAEMDYLDARELAVVNDLVFALTTAIRPLAEAATKKAAGKRAQKAAGEV